MWYRINVDMTNDTVQHHVSELFGDEEWKGNDHETFGGSPQSPA
jgi:hypothetical protein